MAKSNLEAQNPLILRCNRLMEAFAKSDDERDFYLDRLEGFIIYVDLDKPLEELQLWEKELEKRKDRYCLIPKLTFYETKKIMEGFINEKVYDIDTKEKLLDIIQSKEARENFLEFIYDHHAELEKWQTFYQERSRIRIIEWLRNNHFHFVFEEDLDFPKSLIEKVKKELFQTKVGKDILAARKALVAKAKTYYSNEALNPRPKRGRPPKQIQKMEIEPQITTDIYTTVPNGLRGFLFIPDLGGPAAATFSSKFGTEEELLASRRLSTLSETDLSLENINQKLATLRSLSSKWMEAEAAKKALQPIEEIEEEHEEDFDSFEEDLSFKEKKWNDRKPPLSAKQAINSAPQKGKNITPSAPKTQSRQEIKPKMKAKSPEKAPSPKSKTTKTKPAAKAKKIPLRPIMKIKKQPKK
jgi:Uncharacterised protein family (UPF0158)